MMGGFSMGFMWILLAFILVVAIVLAKGHLGQGRSEIQVESSAHSALDVLKMRYARGEIDQEEFEEKKQILFEKYS